MSHPTAVIPPSAHTRRNSAVELLRITAMIMIILSHCSVHDVFPTEPSAFSYNNYILDWCILGNLGVDIFMLISGYFLSQKENPTGSLPRLWAQVFTYSLFCAGLFLLTGHPRSEISWAYVFFPTIHNTYWFFSAYMIFLLLTPYINRMLRTITRGQLGTCISIMILFWAFFPAITQIQLYGDVLPTFLMFYLIGAYFRKYPKNRFSHLAFRLTTVLISFLLLFFSSALFRHHGPALGSWARYNTFFYERNSILAVLTTVSLFSMFIYLPPFHSKLINWIGGCTFGIYLLHDNGLIRSVLWQEWLPKYNYYHTKWLLPGILISAAIVMTAGTLAESLRRITIDKPFSAVVTGVLQKLQSLGNKLICTSGDCSTQKEG